MPSLDYLRIEIFHSAREHRRVVSPAHQFAAGGGLTRFQFRIQQGAINGLVKSLRRMQVEEPAVLTVLNQIERAGGAARNDRSAGRPGFEDDQSERFRN